MKHTIFSGYGGATEATRIINDTYHVSGRLEKDTSIGNIKRFDRRPISREIKAISPQAAADFFEADAWEWVEPPVVRLVTEAEKMERAGQPTLFDLDGGE
jgi:hypothetical protein